MSTLLEQKLTELASVIRSKVKWNDKLTLNEMIDKAKLIEVLELAYGYQFSEEPLPKEEFYKVGSTWFNELIKEINNKTGNNDLLFPAEIIEQVKSIIVAYNVLSVSSSLTGYKYIPQERSVNSIMSFNQLTLTTSCVGSIYTEG